MRTYSRKKLPPEEIEDLEVSCRLCLGKRNEMIQIFNSQSDDVFPGLSMKIMMCLGLEVSREDAYPKLICQECDGELQRFYNFKKSCTTTYRKLKASLSNVNRTCIERQKKESEDKKTNTLPPKTNVVSNDNEKSIVIIVGENFESQIVPSDEKFTVENASQQSIGHLEWQGNQLNEETMSAISENELMELKISELESQQEMINGTEEQAIIQEAENIDRNLNVSPEDPLSTFIVSSLVENGVLKENGDVLSLVDENISTFTLESSDGTEVVMELVEEEPTLTTVQEDIITQCSDVFEEVGEKSRVAVCGVCGARLATRGGLRRHMRVHSGERPYRCRVCGRAFAQREVMRRHELLHAEKLPYQCALCPKAYTQRSALEAHARAHTPPAARPLSLHRCSICPKLFLHRSGVSRHVKQAHQGWRYTCELCAATLSDHSALMRHLRTHRRRDQPPPPPRTTTAPPRTTTAPPRVTSAPRPIPIAPRPVPIAPRLISIAPAPVANV